MMRLVKGDEVRGNPPASTSVFISNLVSNRLTTLSLAPFLNCDPVLVPIPKSSLMQPDTLWVPMRLANALVQNGFGKAVVPCLTRVHPLAKSATSMAKDRPKAALHFDSLGVQMVLSKPKEILLIDDIVTRGATILGSASRLKVHYPNAHIRAFAAMRTISPPDTFSSIYDPCTGTITLNDQDTFRRP